MLRFNARGPEALVDGKAPGPKSKLNDAHRRALVAKIEAGPIPAVDGVVRWRLIDLAQWVFDDYRISVTKHILSRELRALGYRKLSARPRHHAKDDAAADLFKKTSLPSLFRRSLANAYRGEAGETVLFLYFRKIFFRQAFACDFKDRA